jgi:4-hydroxy-tetrahydrodipicolinate synthase
MFATKCFSGVFTAIVTPFQQSGSLDLAAFSGLIDLQLAQGIDGLVVCGSTGEGMTLSDDERATLVAHCVKQVAGRIPIFAGAGHSNTKIACTLQKQMKDLGATATLHVTPWYNKPPQEGLFRHYQAIANINELPIILYNIPSRTGCDLAPSTILRLANECPSIVGLKESNLDPIRLQGLIGELKKTRPDFSVFSGEDGFVLPLLAMGGQGVICVSSNVAPKMFCNMFKAHQQGELGEAQTIAEKLVSLARVMFFRTNPLPVKSALFLSGHIQNSFRLPLCGLNEEDMAYLKSQLQSGGWL